MPDFDQRLADLARHAEMTGRLAPAAAVRARADQRRKRRTAAVAGLGVAVAGALTAGISIAQPLQGRPHPPVMSPAPGISRLPSEPLRVPSASSPPPSAPPSSSSRSADPDRLPQPLGLSRAATGLDHRRAYRIVPVSDGAAGPGALGVAATGRVDVLDAPADFTTETDSPDGTEWLIRVDERDGSRCLSVRADSTIGTRKCDPSDSSQRLRYYRAGTDAQGHPAYVIGFGLDALNLAHERFLARNPADGGRLGLVDVPRAQVATAWSFVDQGPSTLAR
jgi:hypothetical protein